MMKVLQRLLVVGVVLGAWLTPDAALAQRKPVKIGFVDIKRVNEEYSKIEKAVELLNDTFLQRQRELDAIWAKVKELRAKVEKLEAEDKNAKAEGKEGVPESQLNAARTEAAELDREYRNEFRLRSTRFETTKEELLYPRLIEVADAVKKVGEDGHYSVILKKEVTRYAASKNDVTSQVLQILESGAKVSRAAVYESGIRGATPGGNER